MKLLKVDLLEEALEKLKNAMKNKKIDIKEITVSESFEKVLAEDVFSAEDVPHFNRSIMDGYAVHAEDTAGAGESMPTFLDVVGEVEMGKYADFSIKNGECAYVPTGGMLPDGADSVCMVEYCEHFDETRIAVYSAVSYGRNMVFAGDDVKKDSLVLKRGRKITPADMGLLSAIGVTKIKVYKPFKIFIFSTGDEIISPSEKPSFGEMRDVNTYGLIGEAKEFGFEVMGFEIVKDNEEVLKEKIKSVMENCDFVVVSGGSSQGKKDATSSIIDSLTSTGVLTHGIAVKPGKPTIIGFDEPTNCALIGLPGHPVAAMILFRLVVGGMWESLTGNDDKKPSVFGTMGANIGAAAGRKTFQLVTVDYDKLDNSLPLVMPVLGESGLISTMSKADGYIVLDVNDEGINKGERAEVFLL